MRVKALRRVQVLRQTREQTLTQVEAGTVRGLTTRHIRRLIKRLAPVGDQGLAHRGRGTPANRRLPTRSIPGSPLGMGPSDSGRPSPRCGATPAPSVAGCTRR